jgi:hypothetical protein
VRVGKWFHWQTTVCPSNLQLHPAGRHTIRCPQVSTRRTR